MLKPALQGLEITFRFISTALSDPRPYAKRQEWKRRLESLARSQVEIIAMLCEDEAEDGVTRGAAPIVDLTSSDGTLARRNSSAEVWKLSDEVTVILESWICASKSILNRIAEQIESKSFGNATSDCWILEKT
nr:nematode resistance protein-like HSPRO2 [Ipomoea batatas]